MQIKKSTLFMLLLMAVMFSNCIVVKPVAIPVPAPFPPYPRYPREVRRPPHRHHEGCGHGEHHHHKGCGHHDNGNHYGHGHHNGYGRH